MNAILDSLEFQKICSVNENDNAARIKGSIQRCLLALTKENIPAKLVYEHY